MHGFLHHSITDTQSCGPRIKPHNPRIPPQGVRAYLGDPFSSAVSAYIARSGVVAGAPQAVPTNNDNASGGGRLESARGCQTLGTSEVVTSIGCRASLAPSSFSPLAIKTVARAGGSLVPSLRA